MNQNELNKILENHKHWIREDCEGWENMRAVLIGADLRGANLRGAVLTGADLHRANLRGADLHRANLRGADLHRVDLHGVNLCRVNLCGADLHRVDLHGVNLCRVNLCGADLYGVDLCGANLRGADLCGANLRGADLYGADLHRANLHRADLHRANLHRADLHRANLRGADLTGADLRGAELCRAINIPFIPYACPEYGQFIGYKKAGEYMIELEIPEDAKRVSGTTRKCRCDKAKVLRILNEKREVVDIDSVASNYDKSFIYKIGEIVSVDNFDENRWDEYSAGIHFFINFQEAVDYYSN